MSEDYGSSSNDDTSYEDANNPANISDPLEHRRHTSFFRESMLGNSTTVSMVINAESSGSGGYSSVTDESMNQNQQNSSKDTVKTSVLMGNRFLDDLEEGPEASPTGSDEHIIATATEAKVSHNQASRVPSTHSKDMRKSIAASLNRESRPLSASGFSRESQNFDISEYSRESYYGLESDTSGQGIQPEYAPTPLYNVRQGPKIQKVKYIKGQDGLHVSAVHAAALASGEQLNHGRHTSSSSSVRSPGTTYMFTPPIPAAPVFSRTGSIGVPSSSSLINSGGQTGSVISASTGQIGSLQSLPRDRPESSDGSLYFAPAMPPNIPEKHSMESFKSTRSQVSSGIVRIGEDRKSRPGELRMMVSKPSLEPVSPKKAHLSIPRSQNDPLYDMLDQMESGDEKSFFSQMIYYRENLPYVHTTMGTMQKLLIFLMCLFMPPMFFVIGLGLMDSQVETLERERTFKRILLICGFAVLIIALACVGIGIGVGLHKAG